MLIDVRTPAEWAYVGIPDLRSVGKEPLFIPWALFPGMQINPGFAEQVAASGVKPDDTLLFICRSGGRSHHAAMAATQAGFTECYNVLEGFEGDRDAGQHRNTIGGWRAAGLRWVQG